jgi:hypothetical protein
MEQGQKSGELDDRFTADELAMGLFGQLNSYVMIRLLVPDCPLNRQTARQTVRLFLEGAANSNREEPPANSSGKLLKKPRNAFFVNGHRRQTPPAARR